LSIGAYSPLGGAALTGAASGAGPAGVIDASAAARNSGSATAVQDFLNYAKETPAQRMRDAILKSMGLTEQDLEKMTPEQRKAVEETIEKKIKDAAEQAAEQGKRGFVADVTV
jgi:hypothetical protein